jgi:hypothetical protein
MKWSSYTAKCQSDITLHAQRARLRASPPRQVRTREVLREDADAGSADEFARCLLPLPPLVEGDTVKCHHVPISTERAQIYI